MCVSKSIGLAHSWKEIYVSNLGLLETHLEDVDLSITQHASTWSIRTEEIQAESKE